MTALHLAACGEPWLAEGAALQPRLIGVIALASPAIPAATAIGDVVYQDTADIIIANLSGAGSAGFLMLEAGPLQNGGLVTLPGASIPNVRPELVVFNGTSTGAGGALLTDSIIPMSAFTTGIIGIGVAWRNLSIGTGTPTDLAAGAWIMLLKLYSLPEGVEVSQIFPNVFTTPFATSPIYTG
jgi:hypothetical protein